MDEVTRQSKPIRMLAVLVCGMTVGCAATMRIAYAPNGTSGAAALRVTPVWPVEDSDCSLGGVGRMVFITANGTVIFSGAP